MPKPNPGPRRALRANTGGGGPACECCTLRSVRAMDDKCPRFALSDAPSRGPRAWRNRVPVGILLAAKTHPARDDDYDSTPYTRA
jgi:hypothetical protein